MADIDAKIAALALDCVVDHSKISRLQTLLTEFGSRLANYVIQLEDHKSTLLLYTAAR